MSTYYVAPNSTGGTDEGTVDNPYLTFAKALTSVSFGDTIALKDGTYSIGTEFATHNAIPITTFTLSGSGPDNVIIEGAATGTNPTAPSFFGKSDVTITDRFFKLTVKGIQFSKIFGTATYPIFGTSGEDEFRFENCIFDQIASQGPSNLGYVGIIGPPNYVNPQTWVLPGTYNGRGVFKNCIFRRFGWSGNASGNKGLFNCMGMYLRFANCTLYMDTHHPASIGGFSLTNSRHEGWYLFYAGNPGVDSAWTGQGYGSTEFPVNDVKMINCILYNNRTEKFGLFNGRTTATNSYGDKAFYNSELKNCITYDFKNTDAINTEGLITLTNHINVIEEFNKNPTAATRAVDPLFIDEPDAADLNLRPASTLIGYGESVPSSWYDLDRPTTLKSQL